MWQHYFKLDSTTNIRHQESNKFSTSWHLEIRLKTGTFWIVKHKRTHTHTHAHTYMNTATHTWTQPHTPTNTPTYTPMHTESPFMIYQWNKKLAGNKPVWILMCICSKFKTWMNKWWSGWFFLLQNTMYWYFVIILATSPIWALTCVYMCFASRSHRYFP